MEEEPDLVNVMTPLPLFLRKNIILGMLRARVMQGCDSKGVTGVWIAGGGFRRWWGCDFRARGVALTWGW
jgi:hypothetical protein